MKDICRLQRFVPVCLGCLGLLIYDGYASVLSIVMVHILKSDDRPKDEGSSFLRFYCFINASRDVSDYWNVSSSSQYLYCAYYAGVFSTQLFGGYLAARLSPKRIAGIVILISSVLSLAIPTAIKANVLWVYAIRIVQGVFEGCSYPALSGVISAWTPNSEKSRMVTIMNAGGYLSPSVASVVSGITVCVLSWNASLYIYGCCGVLWSIIWLISVRDTPSQHSGLSLSEKMMFAIEEPDRITDRIPWRKILSSLPVWAIMISSFCRNWMYSGLTLGIPQYFKIAFTRNIAEIGLESALPSVCLTIVSMIGAVLVDKLIKTHLVSTTVGRKIALCVGFGVEGCCFLSLRFVDRKEIALIVLCVGVAFSGLSVSGYQTNPLDLAPQYVSILTGIYRMGTFGGVLNAAVSGVLNPNSIHVWQNIFTMDGSVLIAAAVFYGVFASGERQNWNENSETVSLINHGAQDKAEARLCTVPKKKTNV